VHYEIQTPGNYDAERNICVQGLKRLSIDLSNVGEQSDVEQVALSEAMRHFCSPLHGVWSREKNIAI